MNKDERQHYDRLCSIGCIVCHIMGYGYSPCEIHHIRSGTGAGRKSHYSKAIGLCPNHHRLGGYGIAIHAGVSGFEKTIGMTELELLEKQLELLGD